ncbi:MAG: hypothetical protein V2A78_07680 [bacterium]
MKLHSSVTRACMLLLALSLLATLNSCTSGTSGGGAPPVPRDINKFISSLENDHFTVQEGQVIYLDALKMASEGLLKSCFGNNQGSPYLTYILPPAPGQNPAAGQNPPVHYNPNDPNNYPANPDFYPPGLLYKLRNDEAIVFIGKITPKCVYFGYRSYVFYVENKPGKEYPPNSVIGNSTTGLYHPIFGSLGDQLNNLNIYSDGTPSGKPGVPFDSVTAIIVSADRGINQRVRSALVQSGYPSYMVNDDVIPSGFVKMGLEKGKDAFSYLMRISQFENAAAGKNFLDTLGSTSRVFRVTPQDSTALQPYPVPVLKPRGSGKSEFEILSNVTEDMEYLRSRILQTYAAPGYNYTELNTVIGIPEGFVAYANDVNAQGDNRDTTYLKADDFQFNSDDDFLIIYGLNHDMSGKSIYNNAVFYGKALLNGVATVFSQLFLHSAVSYFPQGYSNADKYYVYKMARNASPGENCVVIPKSTGNPDGSAYGVDNNQDVFVAFRAYIELATGIGTSYYEIQYDRAIIFHKI